MSKQMVGDDLAARVLGGDVRALARLVELPVERLLVSHGKPVLEDARTRMAEALARR